MIKLILSIIIPILFVSNYLVCEYLYPGFNKDWAIFIPMDKLAHNFWAVIVFLSVVASTLKTKYPITDYFLHLTAWLCFFDVLDRVAFDYNVYTPIQILFGMVLASITYAYAQRCNNNRDK